MANGTLKVSNIQTSSGSGTITVGASGETVDFSNGTITLNSAMKNTPAFMANLSANQTSVSDDTFTKVQFDEEVVETDSAYDNSTNYRFTVPSGQGGKYYITASVDVDSESNTNLDSATTQIRKNGTYVYNIEYYLLSNPPRRVPVHTGVIMDLSASDYLEVFCRIEANDASGGRFNGAGNGSFFGGYKLIGV